MMGVGAKRALGLYRSCAPRQWRYASIHSQPTGGGEGSGRLRMRISCSCRPRLQIATISSASLRSTRSTRTGHPWLDPAVTNRPLFVCVFGHDGIRTTGRLSPASGASCLSTELPPALCFAETCSAGRPSPTIPGPESQSVPGAHGRSSCRCGREPPTARQSARSRQGRGDRIRRHARALEPGAVDRASLKRCGRRTIERGGSSASTAGDRWPATEAGEAAASMSSSPRPRSR